MFLLNSTNQVLQDGLVTKSSSTIHTLVNSLLSEVLVNEVIIHVGTIVVPVEHKATLKG